MGLHAARGRPIQAKTAPLLLQPSLAVLGTGHAGAFDIYSGLSILYRKSRLYGSFGDFGGVVHKCMGAQGAEHT